MCRRLVKTRGRGRGVDEEGRRVPFLPPTALDMSTSPAVEARCVRAALPSREVWVRVPGAVKKARADRF